MIASSIRPATVADASAIAELMQILDHRLAPAEVANHIAALNAAGIPQLVAVDGNLVVGLCGLHQMTAIHRHKPVGRITILAVSEDRQGQGIGKALVETAVDHFRKQGCGLVEVTSNDRLRDAHAFYVNMGFERTSKRFALKLD